MIINGIAKYKVVLRHRYDDYSLGGIEYEDVGSKNPPEWIILDGFESDQCIDLEQYWEIIQSQNLNKFETDVTVRETIIKFGETQQLIDHYQLIIHTDFNQ